MKSTALIREGGECLVREHLLNKCQNKMLLKRDRFSKW